MQGCRYAGLLPHSTIIVPYWEYSLLVGGMCYVGGRISLLRTRSQDFRPGAVFRKVADWSHGMSSEEITESYLIILNLIRG